jgi:hypothetical protein
MAKLTPSCPSSLLTNESSKKDRKTGITQLPPIPLLSAEPAPSHHFIWPETSRHQWLPGSPSPLDRTFVLKTPQSPAHVGICLLSSSPPFEPPCLVLSSGLSTGYRGGEGACASGYGSLSHHTTITCRQVCGQTIVGTLRSVHVQTLVENLPASYLTHVLVIGLLGPALPLYLYLKCLLSLSASHFTLAADLLSEIPPALLQAEVYGRWSPVLPLPSRAMLA